jgi:hypothetical protein
LATSLKFINQDAIPRECEIMLADKLGIVPVMDWYGAYFAGDDYRVMIDGREVPMGINGEFQIPTIDVLPNRKFIENDA